VGRWEREKSSFEAFFIDCTRGKRLIRKLDDFNIYIAIAGFKNTKIGDVDRFFKVVRNKLRNVDAVQFFDAQLVANWQHLYFAAINALTAFANKTNISSNLAMETLLYASAQRQIKKATETFGVKSTTKNVAVLILAKNEKSADDALNFVQKLMSAEHDDIVLEINREKFVSIKRFFNVSDVELSAKLEKKGLEKDALVDLVIEHGALLATQR
jgi:tRNA threonylcarbamoyladenosine modification (KEOPS) complex Cgi121 subunit